jgi:hypothetical protein
MRGDNTKRKLKERPNKEIGTGEQRNRNKLNGKTEDTDSRGGQHHHRLHSTKPGMHISFLCLYKN